MQIRPVPRNIDSPNRVTEYVFAFMLAYYGLQFIFYKPLISFGGGFVAVYFMYRLTLGKPEGVAFRLLYRYLKFGKLFPNPKKAPKFEI